MIARDIKCGACGQRGKVEAHDTVNVTAPSDIFRNLGKDSSTGYLHFRCPACNADLEVDPMKMFGSGQVTGYPTGSRSRRYVPIVWGLIYTAGALFLFFEFKSWWAYIVGGVLLMLGWASLKTGFFASPKEIARLMGPGPVSEDTKGNSKSGYSFCRVVRRLWA